MKNIIRLISKENGTPSLYLEDRYKLRYNRPQFSVPRGRGRRHFYVNAKTNHMKYFKTKEGARVFEAQSESEMDALMAAWYKCQKSPFDDNQLVAANAEEFVIIFDELRKRNLI